jgi:hypothetical protein
MGDFFTPPAGYPPPPPEPDTPSPDFSTIAANLGIGINKSGVLNGIFVGLAEALLRWVTLALGLLLTVALKIFAWFIGVVGDVTSDAQAGYGKVVSATLQELFGVTVDPASVSSRQGNAGKQAAATQMGQTLVQTLFSNMPTATGSGVPPSESAADKYLGTMMNMELNGWIESWFTDGVSGHVLEKYGDLKDGISKVLGLGRMSRQAFAPPLKIFVHDPYLAALNQKFRPKPIPEELALWALHTGAVSRDDLSTILGNQGYTEQEINWLTLKSGKFIPDADLDYLISRGQMSQSDALIILQNQGWTEFDANLLLEILADKRTHKYVLEIVATAEAAYVRGDLDVAGWQNVVSTVGLTSDEQTWILKVADVKRACNITHLSLGQIEQGVLDGIMNLNDVKTWATRVNMPADEEAFLELMILFKQNKQSATQQAKAAAAAAKASAAQAKQAAATQKAAAAKAQAADKGVTVAQAETLVKDGLWTFDQLTAFLTAKGYGADAINSIVALLHAAIAKTSSSASTAAAVRATAAAKGLSLAQVEKAVVAGILTSGDLANYLAGHGFDQADAQVIVELTEEAVATAKTKAAAKTAAQAKAAAKSISLPELERAVRLGLTTTDAYNAALQAAGFDPMSITLLDGILNSQIVSDKATAAKRAAAAGSATSTGITVAQLEQEVIQGIRPIADYTAELVKLGYDPADQTDLTELLQVKVDQAKATAAKRAAAGTALSNRGISIADAERAVKLGVVPIATYQQLLSQAGFTQDAIDVLTNTLLAQVASTKKTQTAANAAAGTVATKGISLPQLEKAVIAGLQPIDDYTRALTTSGYSEADAGTLTDLLQLKVDQAARAAAAHADAIGAATQKGISLANEEAAVVAGNKTMADYDALLTSLGYDDVDRATLESLLQTKVNAAAAKAGGTPPAPASGANGGPTTTPAP